MTPLMLKSLPPCGVELLRIILNNSLGQGVVPQLLKRETIVPVLKPGKDKSDLGSYRPI